MTIRELEIIFGFVAVWWLVLSLGGMLAWVITKYVLPGDEF